MTSRPWKAIVEELRLQRGYDATDTRRRTPRRAHLQRESTREALLDARRTIGWPATFLEQRATYLGRGDLLELDDGEVKVTSVDHFAHIGVEVDGYEITSGEAYHRWWGWNTAAVRLPAPYPSQDHTTLGPVAL